MTNLKQAFSNLELFEIFKISKLLVLILVENEIITVDYKISELIYYTNNQTNTKYHQFFYPEIKKYLESQEIKKLEQEISQQDINEFKNKRKIGQNEIYLCELIRNDSIEDFITYHSRNMFILQATIVPSIYETNPILSKSEVTLIEYAAFYGAIQIIRFLISNDIELEPPLWIFAIHSNNAEIIHFLEENHVKPPDGTFKSCLDEAIKCHHNGIAQYIKDVLMNEKYENCEAIFKYYNYNYIPDVVDNDIIFYNLCRYNYTNFVDLYLNPKKEELNYINKIAIDCFYDVLNLTIFLYNI